MVYALVLLQMFKGGWLTPPAHQSKLSVSRQAGGLQEEQLCRDWTPSTPSVSSLLLAMSRWTASLSLISNIILL